MSWSVAETATISHKKQNWPSGRCVKKLSPRRMKCWHAHCRRTKHHILLPTTVFSEKKRRVSKSQGSLPSPKLTYPLKSPFWVDDFYFPKVGYVIVPWRASKFPPTFFFFWGGGERWTNLIRKSSMVRIEGSGAHMKKTWFGLGNVYSDPLHKRGFPK